MEYIHILLLITINAASCYHFYNPASHQMLTFKSLRNIPRGYRLLPSPRTNRRRLRLARVRTYGTCRDVGFTCDSPYDRSATQQFECTSDKQCPSSYRCCPQKCFLHNICVQVSSEIIDDTNNNCNKPRPGQCEKWPYHCQRPYSYGLTSIFKCNGDDHCPRNFKCCQQSCFSHRICSRIVEDVDIDTPPVEIKRTTRRTTTTTTTEATPTTEETEIQEETETEPTTIVTEDDYEEETVTTEKEEDYNETEEIGTTETTEAEEEEEEADTTTESTTETIVETTEAEEEEEADTTTESTTETIVETTEAEEEEDADNPVEDITETESETEEVSTTISEEGEVDLESTGGQLEVTVVVKNSPSVTTQDSNAINPDYAPYYYHYDNNTETYDDYDEYEEGED